MKKITCMLSFVLLLGCARSPQVWSTFANGKDGFHAHLNQKPYFSIITDGDVSGGVTAYAHISATFKGTISDKDNSETMSFKASGKNIRIGKQEFDIENGQYFLISTNESPFAVKQIIVTEDDKINALVTSDVRMHVFFK